MSARLAVIVAVVCLSLTQGVRADIVKLANGGELKASLEELVFLADGKEVRHLRKDIRSLRVSEGASDRLALNDGTVLNGEIVSVKAHTVGGVMNLARREFTGLQLLDAESAPSADANHRLLAEKRAKIAPDDSKGLIELADWCREKGLKPESKELAKACLEANPDYDSTEKAHEILGHVLYQDEWMTPEEMARRKAATEETIEPGPLSDEGGPKPGLAGLTPALKQAFAHNEELYKAYCAKVAKVANDKLNAVRQKYRPQYDRLTAEITRLAADREALKNASDQRSNIVSLVEAEQSAISGACRRSKAALQAVYLRHKRSLLGGNNLRQEDIAAAYEAALRVK